MPAPTATANGDLSSQLRSARAEIDELRDRRAVLLKQRDDAKAEFPQAGDVPVSQMERHPSFRAAQKAVQELEAVDHRIEEATRVELGLLSMTGSQRAPGLNGPQDDPSGIVRGNDGWSQLAATLDPFGGKVEARLDNYLQMQAAVAPPTQPASISYPTQPGTPALVELGRDQRRFYNTLQRGPVLDPGSLSVTDWRNTSRAINEHSGDGIERLVMSTDLKAELVLGLELNSEDLKLFALTCTNIPNKLLSSVPTFEQFLRAELRYALDNQLDAHCIAQVLAATPQSGQVGANLVEQSRNAIASLAAAGAQANVLVVGSDDAVALDLLTQPGVPPGGYIFVPDGAGTIWRLLIVEVAQAICASPIVTDTRRLGALYTGGIGTLVDPYGDGLTHNTFAIRSEYEALAVIRDGTAAYVIEGS